MPAHNPVERKLHAAKGLRSRWQPGADTSDLDRAIKYVKAEDYIRAVVDSAPQLSEASRDKLALLLRGGSE